MIARSHRRQFPVRETVGSNGPRWLTSAARAGLLLAILGFLGSASAATNSPPTILAIPSQTVLVDHPTVAFQLTLDDLETPILGLSLTGVSSAPAVVPNENIFFGTAQGHRYITATPAFGATGSATITVTVSDGQASASTNFTVTVEPPPPGTFRFTNPAPITIPELGPATPYPSVIQVTGMHGTVSGLSMTLSKFSHQNVRDVSILLIGPTGHGAVLFSRVSGTRSCTNVTVYLTDTSNYFLPGDFDLWSEPLRPADYLPGDFFPGAPPGPYGPSAFTAFRGMPADGDWSLYIYDDGDGNGGSIAAGWSLLMTVVPGGSSSPTISPIPDQSTSPGLDLPPIPFTVDDPDTLLDNLRVTADSSDVALVPLERIVLGGSGRDRTVAVSPLPGQLGTARITLTVSDGTATASSSFFLSVTQAYGGTLIFANTAPIVIRDFEPANPYPSTITVDGVSGTIKKLAVTIRDMQHNYPADVDMLLVGPQGQKIIIFSDAGRRNIMAGATVTLSDDASKPLPAEGEILSGTYNPTDYEPGELGELDSFPGAPDGPISQHLSVFNNYSPNGTWSLYIVDDGPGDEGKINGGWNLQITVRQVSLTSVSQLDGGIVRLRGLGEGTEAYRIQVSEDLVHWQDIGTTTADEAGAFELDDPGAASRSVGFYRAVLPGPSSP